MSATTEAVVWALRAATYRPPGGTRATIDDVSLQISRHRTTALIGPNGAGKTTLLRLLLGTLAPQHGSIVFDGRPIADWTRRDLAGAIAVVPQGESESLFTVGEVVAMGRYPHLG